MNGRFSQTETLDDRVQILLGVFSAESGLPIGLKRTRLFGDLLCQPLDESSNRQVAGQPRHVQVRRA
jgi:hypothetical protein